MTMGQSVGGAEDRLQQYRRKLDDGIRKLDQLKLELSENTSMVNQLDQIVATFKDIRNEFSQELGDSIPLEGTQE